MSVYYNVCKVAKELIKQIRHFKCNIGLATRDLVDGKRGTRDGNQHTLIVLVIRQILN